MKLLQILDGVDAKIVGKKNREITNLSHMAQSVKKNGIYFCLKGSKNNGADFLQTAIENGCKVIVAEDAIENKHITQVIVGDARKAMSQMAANFFGRPAKKLKIVGVTGTNGKTTVCHMVAHVLSQKHKVGIIGTNGAEFDGKILETNMTTPDPILLHKLLAQMEQNGVEVVVMEMSAHAIFLQKLWGIMPHITAFTNLSQDHLDYFENMDKYFEAKAELFAQKNYDKAVVCIDTEYGKKIADLAKNVTTCSSTKQADIFASNLHNTNFGQVFDCSIYGTTVSIKLNLFGKFNLQNAIVAIAICFAFGFSAEEIASQIDSFVGVDGRFECIECGKTKVIIDYAHTPDGLANLLESVKTTYPKEKLVCVFGCGGNRDAQKRPLMGAVAEKYADQIIVTTDNPRYEDNFQIAQDIISGITKKKYQMILDRGQAIRTALADSKKGTVVVIAGKGAEKYIEIAGTKVDFCDKKFVQSLTK